MWRKLADVCFWIGLSLYFGGIIVVGAVAAPAVFRVANATPLSMPGIADPPLDMGNQVGGEVFGEILYRFGYIEAIALALMLAGIAGWLLGHQHIRRSTWIILIFWTLVAALAAVDAGIIRPKVWSLRTTVRQQAPEHAAAGASARWPEREQFDRLHKLDETLGRAKAYILLAMLVVTAWRGLAEKRAAHGAMDAPDVLRKSMSKPG